MKILLICVMIFVQSVFASEFEEKISAYGVVKPLAISTIIAINNGIITRIIKPLGENVQNHNELLEVLEKETTRYYRTTISGQVAKVHITEGAVITPGMPLITVLDPTKKEIEISLSPQEAQKVKTGTIVRQSGTSEIFGTLSRISPLVDPDSGAVVAFIKTQNKVHQNIGDIIAIDLIVQKIQDCKTVPIADVSIHKDHYFVKSLQDGYACLQRKLTAKDKK